MMFQQEQENKQSKYNSAIAQLYRLDNLWQSAHYNSRAGYLIKWNWDLDAIWRELAGDANKDDVKEFYKFKKAIVQCPKIRNLQYQILEYKEIFLRKLQNKQGKGTAYVDPDEDLLEE